MHYPTTHLRPAHPDEAAALSALALASKAHWGYDAAFMEACRAELTYTPEQVASAEWHFIVAVEADAVAGFYALQHRTPDDAELEALFVRPDAIGRGLGRLLIDDAKRAAAARGASTLMVQGDPHAEGFYRAAGGVLVGRRASGSIPGRTLPVYRIPLRLPGT